MKPTIITIICAALIAIGAAYWLDAGELSHRTPYPKATPPPPPSPEFTPSPERAPTAREIDKASREHYALLQMSIERALVARDPQQRETAFTFLLPELLQVEPARVVQMMKKQEPGEARDALRREVARQWVMRDREAAVGWIKSLENDAERRDAAEIAVSALAAVAPDQAIEVADQFGIGRDNGYLEHLVQIWAESDLDAATQWARSQPDNAQSAQLRARIDQVRAAQSGRDEAGRDAASHDEAR